MAALLLALLLAIGWPQTARAAERSIDKCVDIPAALDQAWGA